MDPNKPIPMCEEHWEGYREHWQERWDEYNSGRL